MNKPSGTSPSHQASGTPLSAASDSADRTAVGTAPVGAQPRAAARTSRPASAAGNPESALPPAGSPAAPRRAVQDDRADEELPASVREEDEDEAAASWDVSEAAPGLDASSGSPAEADTVHSSASEEDDDGLAWMQADTGARLRQALPLIGIALPVGALLLSGGHRGGRQDQPEQDGGTTPDGKPGDNPAAAATLKGVFATGMGAVPDGNAPAALQVTVTTLDGRVLGGPNAVAADGTFSITVSDYRGPVLVQVGPAGVSPDTEGWATAMAAVTVTGGQDMTLAVTPLTTLAAMMLQGQAATDQQPAQAHAAVAEWFGVGDILQPPRLVLNPDGSPAEAPDLHGRVLAVLEAAANAASLTPGQLLTALAEALPAGTAGQPPSLEAVNRATQLLLDGLEDAASHSLDGPSADAFVREWAQAPVYLGTLRQTDVNGLQTFTLTLTGDFKVGDRVVISQDGAPREDLAFTVTTDTASLRVNVAGSSLGQGDGPRHFGAEVIRGDSDVRATNSLDLQYDGPPDALGLSIHRNELRVDGLEPGASLQVSLDGGLSWQTATGDQFNLPDGRYAPDQVLVRQVDGIGQISANTSQAEALVVDTTVLPPLLSLVNDTGASATDGITQDATVRVSQLEAGGTWAYSLDGGQHWTEGIGDTVPASAFTAQGAASVIVRQTDAAGNTAVSEPLHLILDTQADTVTLSLKLDTGVSDTDHLTNDGRIVVSGLEEGAPWSYSVDSGHTWQEGVGSEIPASAFGQDGYRLVLVRHTDLAGNVGKIAVIDIDLDTSVATPVLSLRDDSGASDTDLITNDPTVVLAPLEERNAWQFSVDGGQTWWSGTGDTILASDLPAGAIGADGEIHLTVRQIDQAGNISASATLDFKLDTEVAPPDVTLSNDTGDSDSDSITSDATLVISGLEDGATWDYRIGLDGDWQAGSGNEIPGAALTQGRPDGDIQVTIRQTDVAGNTAERTVLITVDRQIDAPTLSLRSDSGARGDGYTNSGAVIVDGLEAGAHWSYQINGGAWTAGSGNLILGSAFTAQGAQTVVVRQTDLAGNTVQSDALAFTLDSQVATPTLQLISDTGHARDRVTQDGSIRVSGLEDGGTWRYLVDDGTWQLGSGDTIPAAAFSGDGPHTVYVRQIDRAGNISREATLDLVLDTQADLPVLSLTEDTGVSDTDNITSDGGVTVAGLESGARWDYRIDGGDWVQGQGSSIASSAVPDGQHTIDVRQTDAAGNESALATLTLTVDRTVEAPTLSLTNDTGTSDQDLVTNDATVTVGGLEPGAQWSYRINGGEWVTGDGTEIPADAFTDEGLQTVEVVQTDVAGNESSAASFSFLLDTQPDSASTVTIRLKNDSGNSKGDRYTNEGTLLLTGLDPERPWSYSLDNGKTFVMGDGNQIDGSAFPKDGQYRVIVRQSDLAGNAVDSLPFFLWLDTTPGAAPTLTLKQDTGALADDAVTSDGTLLIGVESGARWEYRLNDGNWTAGSGRELSGTLLGPDGPVKVDVRQIDPAGNVSPAATVNLVLDTTVAPLVPTLQSDTGDSDDDLVTQDGTVVIAGLEAGARWEYRINGGDWTVGTGLTIADSVLSDGRQTIEVRQTDAAGNTSIAQTLIFDRISQMDAPTLSLESDTGTPGDKLTGNGTVIVAGLGQQVTWRYTTDTDLTQATWVTGSGDRIPDSAFETDGRQQVTVQVTDAAGNAATSQTLVFDLDRTVSTPTLRLKNDTGLLSNDRHTKDGTLSIVGLEPGGTWEYSLDNVTWTAGSGSEVPAAAMGTDGAKQVWVRQTDAAGNRSAAARIEFVLTTATDAPTLALSNDTGSSATDQITANAGISVAGLVEESRWEYSLDGNAWHAGSGSTIPSSVFTTDGSYTVQVRQTDTAGNVSAAASLSFTLDKTVNSPVLALSVDTGASATDRITSNGSIKLTGLENGSTWEYSLDNGQTWKAGSGSTLDGAVFKNDGQVSVQVRQTDVAGNTSAAAQLSFTLLREGPVIDLLADDGVQSTVDQTIGIASTQRGNDLTATSASLTTPGLQTLYVRIEGLDALDRIVVDRRLVLDRDLDGKNVSLSGVSGLSYNFNKATGLLSISKTDGSALTGLEAGILTNSIQLTNPATTPAAGDRRFEIYGKDMAGNVGDASVVTITVDTRLPTLDLNGGADGLNELQYVNTMQQPLAVFASDLQVGHENPDARFAQVVIVESGGGTSRTDQLVSQNGDIYDLLSNGAQLQINGRLWTVTKISATYTLKHADGTPADADEVAAMLASLRLLNDEAEPGQGERKFTVHLTDQIGNTTQASGTVMLDQTPPVADLNGSAPGLNYETHAVAGAHWMLPMFNPSTAGLVEASPVTQITVVFSSSVSSAFGTVAGREERISLTDGNDSDDSDDTLLLGQGGTLTYASLIPGRVVTLQLSGDATRPVLVITADAPLTPAQAALVLQSLRYEGGPDVEPGLRELSVTATDVAGNSSIMATVSQLNVLQPGVPMVFLDQESDTGTHHNDNVTRLNGSAAAPLRLVGAGRPGATLSIYRDANHDGQPGTTELVGTVICDADGHWRLDLPPTALPDGVHDFMAVDAAVQLQSPTLSITVDTRPPPSTFGMGKSVSLMPVLAGVSDPNERVLVEIDTDNDLSNGYELRYEVRTDANGQWRVDTATQVSLSGAQHLFQDGDTVNARVTSFDLAGNQTVRLSSSTAVSSVFDISDAHVVEGTEGTRELVFMVTRSGDLGEAGSVQWSVDLNASSARDNPNGLMSERDFSGALSGAVSFAPGETQKLVKFTVHGDDYREVNERLVVNLEQPSGGRIGDGLGIGNINEVDITLLQAAYGMRDLNANLNTAAIRVRRSSDNQEMDIGFDANGDLDTKALLDFVGRSAKDKGYVTTWYDQSGNGRDMMQPATNMQGVIVSGGSLVTRSDGSVGISFNTLNGSANDYMYASGEAGTTWRSTVIYAKVQSQGSQDGSLFNLGSDGSGRLSAHYPESSGNRGYVFDVYDTSSTGRLKRPVDGGNAALLGLANDIVFEAHSGVKSAGTEDLNYTDSAQAIYENGVRVVSDGTLRSTFSTSSVWQLGRHSSTSSYYQRAIYNEFMVYLATDNSTPELRALTGTSSNDVLTYSGESRIQQIDGLTGFDTLYLSGSVNLDFAQMSGGVRGIEQVWMDNGQANTLTLSTATLAANGNSVLTVMMDAGDSLILNGLRMDYDAARIQAVIIGQDGNDVLYGTAGNDVMYGGTGADAFTWHANQGGVDTILDFSNAQGDSLDLSELLRLMPQGSEALYMRKHVDANGQVSVQVDWDGQGGFDDADLTIVLQSTSAVDPIAIQTQYGTTVL